MATILQGCYCLGECPSARWRWGIGLPRGGPLAGLPRPLACLDVLRHIRSITHAERLEALSSGSPFDRTHIEAIECQGAASASLMPGDFSVGASWVSPEGPDRAARLAGPGGGGVHGPRRSLLPGAPEGQQAGATRTARMSASPASRLGATVVARLLAVVSRLPWQTRGRARDLSDAGRSSERATRAAVWVPDG